MKYLKRIVFTMAVMALFVGTAGLSHAKGLKGTVKLHGAYCPCEIVKLLDVATESTCDNCEELKRDVIVVQGDLPTYKEGTTVIVKFKGKERAKSLGKIRCKGDEALIPAEIKKCVKKGQYILWLGSKNRGYVVIETEKGVFKKVHPGDRAILKAKVRRAVVEGC